MRYLILSGVLLAGDFFAQANTFLSRFEAENHSNLMAAAFLSLVPAAHHFADAAFHALTDHGETYLPVWEKDSL